MKKTVAEMLFCRIGEGHRNALGRPDDDGVDRALRRMIEKANINGDCIISGDNGYYRPIPTDKIDDFEYKTYMAKERSRIESLLLKEECMKVAYESRKRGCEYASKIRSSRKTAGESQSTHIPK